MRKVNIIGIVVFIVVFSAYAYITWPHKIQTEIKGIEYSRTDAEHVERITIRIHGTMKKEMTGGRIFTGTIELESASLLLPKQKLTLPFDDADWSNLSFRDLNGKLFYYGDLFADEDMSEVVIVAPDDKKSEAGSGMILVFPAEDRTDAEELTLQYFEKERNAHFGQVK